MATSLTSAIVTPRRALSVARYSARAASLIRRMRPQRSTSQKALRLTCAELSVAPTSTPTAVADLWKKRRSGGDRHISGLLDSRHCLPKVVVVRDRFANQVQ